VGKASTVTMTAIPKHGDPSLHMSSGPVTGWQKRIQGALFGAANPLYDIPKLLGLYRSGDLKLDELITRRYRLDEVNDGYADMMAGRNVRGVIVHEH
jgi:alcohol dehydrogenase (nicotinoprotein)